VLHYPERFNIERVKNTADPRPLQPKVVEATLGDTLLFYFVGAHTYPSWQRG
jgi:hypothetical protein